MHPQAWRSPKVRLLVVVAYALAMAWVESAAVLYLRTLVGRVVPYQPDPLPVAGTLGGTELIREVATMVMLFTVGWLAGRTWRARFGYMLVAFGLWDIFYYVFLHAIVGWPPSLLTWDVLFLVPLPWWGPVLAPVLVAILLVVAGAVLTGNDVSSGAPLWPSLWTILLNGLGTVLALGVFMADAIRAVRHGVSPAGVLPRTFPWPLFLLAWALMAAPVVDLCRAAARRGRATAGGDAQPEARD
jgi:hypothetical protein